MGHFVSYGGFFEVCSTHISAEFFPEGGKNGTKNLILPKWL